MERIDVLIQQLLPVATRAARLSKLQTAELRDIHTQLSEERAESPDPAAWDETERGHILVAVTEEMGKRR